MSRLSKSDLVMSILAVRLERLAVHIGGRFEAAGIDHLLVKGPAFARWLYGPDEVRSYTDIDFIVPEDQWDRAVEVLLAEGFRDALGSMAHPRMESHASHPWTSPAGDIDLHSRIDGFTAPAAAVWDAFWQAREPLRLEDGEVATVDETVRLVHLGVHVAHHRGGQSMDDLERALEVVDDARWARAGALAERLGAEAAFLSGLRSFARGQELVQRLGLRDVRSVDTELRGRYIPLAEGLHQLSELRGWRARIRMVLRELVPTPDFMRWWFAPARRGSAGLLLGYLWRPVYILSRLPAALLALRRARREAAASE